MPDVTPESLPLWDYTNRMGESVGEFQDSPPGKVCPG